MPTRPDLGDTAAGRVCSPSGRLATPARTATGRVVTVYPLDPRTVQVTTHTGETCTIRLAR